MDTYEKKYKEIVGQIKKAYLYAQTDSTKAVLEEIFHELKNERIRKKIIATIHLYYGEPLEDEAQEMIAWLKQGTSYTKRDIDDAFVEGMAFAKDELEKQGTPAKLSEEEQNRFAKGVLTSCALSFINYLDAHKYEGKMCVSNGECEDIENAFHNAMWDRLHRYYCKYIEKQGEQ